MKVVLKRLNMASAQVDTFPTELVDTLSPKAWDREVKKARGQLARKQALEEKRVTERVDRALSIKRSTIRKLDRRNPNSAWLVPSQTEDGVFYIVTESSCTCKGFEYRQFCKHLDKVKTFNK